MTCEGGADEVDAAAVAGEAAITPTQAAGAQSAAGPRRRTARAAAVQKARGPLSTKPQDLQVTTRRLVNIRLFSYKVKRKLISSYVAISTRLPQ